MGLCLAYFYSAFLQKECCRKMLLWLLYALLHRLYHIYLSMNATKWFNGYSIGIELLLINGLLTFAGLLLVSKKNIHAVD